MAKKTTQKERKIGKTNGQESVPYKKKKSKIPTIIVILILIIFFIVNNTRKEPERGPYPPGYIHNNK